MRWSGDHAQTQAKTRRIALDMHHKYIQLFYVSSDVDSRTLGFVTMEVLISS